MIWLNNINIVNNVPGLKVTVNEIVGGGYTVSISKEGQKALADFLCGSVVKIGEREYIVLEHMGEGEEKRSAVITKDFVKTMEFGKTGEYPGSNVDEYLRKEFYLELIRTVGKDNVKEFTIDLMADDGTGEGKNHTYHASLLTTDLYRKYRKFLPAYGKWWWLATRVSYGVKDYDRYVCDVHSSGVLSWDVCDCSGGVRPFCILNSSILVSE